jgi:hypothetical protein
MLIMTLVSVNAGPASVEDTPKAGSLQAQLKQAMPEGPTTAEDLHRLKYGLSLVEAIHWIFGVSETAEVLGLFALPLEVVGPVNQMVSFWVELGSAHAEAINSVIKDEIESGFSRGVVLGADQRSPDYLKSNYWVKFSPVPNSVYPEYGRKFQNAYNSALIAGYAQGKALSKEQSGAFFSDLFARMSENPAVTYGADSKLWTDRNWRDYYLDCAMVFRRDHLK